jgi:hypothetical protein
MGIPSAGNALQRYQPEEAIRGAPGCAIMFNIRTQTTNLRLLFFILNINLHGDNVSYRIR